MEARASTSPWGKVMFTLNKLRDTLSHVGGDFGEVEAAGCVSLPVGAFSSDSFEKRDFVQRNF